MSTLLDGTEGEIVVQQRKELAELFGFETRNKYEIFDGVGRPVGFAAEKGKGFLAALGRHFFGHWRTFEIVVFDMARNAQLRALHPFRWFFQRLEVRSAQGGERYGAIQQRWGWFIYRRFEIEDRSGRVVMKMQAPVWRIWTFPIFRAGREVATIRKRWSGGLTELFTDADTFRIEMHENLDKAAANLLLAAALFIDLQYFERRASDD